jgi:L-ascorbate metabolism protein UlaG (beta-lactamase superfamily)
MRWISAALLLAVTVAASTCARASAQGVDTLEKRPTARVESNVPAVAAELGVRYLANEGFLVEGAGKRVLVDGLFGTGVTGYPVAPTRLREELESGTGEWGDIQVALATHYHPDHFHPDSVARFLAANPEAVFLSTPQATGRLRRSHPEATGLLARARAVLPAKGTVERLEIRGIGIEVLNLHHGRRSPPVENLGFVVTLGRKRFIHFGDTEAKMQDFEPYLELLRNPDLALLPFWFLSSEWRAGMVRDLIRPRWIVVAHMPLETASPSHFGRWRSYDNLVRVIETAFPKARFPRDSGESYRFGDE